MDTNGGKNRRPPGWFGHIRREIRAALAPQPIEQVICPKCLGRAKFLGNVLVERHTEEGVEKVGVTDMSVCDTSLCGTLFANTRGEKLYFGRFKVFQAAYVAPRAANSP
jgi:hypothetical protein